MRARGSLLSSTMLTGVAGSMLLAPSPGDAADLKIRPGAEPVPYLAPAVDGINYKAEGFGGTFADRSLYAGLGAISIPVGAQYGLQIDGLAGSLGGKGLGAIAGHFFWRNPASGLVGLYGSYTHWNEIGGIHAVHAGVEAAAYFGRYSLEGLVGVESGNTRSETSGGVTTTYEIKTRFFDKLNFAYYPTDNIKLLIGHRYLGGQHAAAFGAEAAFSAGHSTMASLFVEARAGEHDFQGVWGGLKVYFGNRDKTLMRRHREDDPYPWQPDTLFTLTNQGSAVPVGAGTPANPCPPGDILVDGMCVVAPV
jgi:hypothetical protein